MRHERGRSVRQRSDFTMEELSGQQVECLPPRELMSGLLDFLEDLLEALGLKLGIKIKL
jgi:hypothetical protein